MKKTISIILSIVLTFSCATITGANTTYLTGKIFINNAKNISFNNNWGCEINNTDNKILKFKNVNNCLDITIREKYKKSYYSTEHINVIMHKNNTSINESKNILTQLLIDKEFQLKDFKNYQEYSPGENEYVYSVINLSGKTLELNSKYGSVVYFIKCFPNEKKTFIGTKVIKANKPINNINSYIDRFRNEIKALNTNQIIKKARPLSSKSKKHFNKIKKYLEKNKFRFYKTKTSPVIYDYYECFSVISKKESKFKKLLMTCSVTSSREKTNWLYKTTLSNAKKIKNKNKYIITKKTKFKTKKYKGFIIISYNKKQKKTYLLSLSLNKKTNIIVAFYVSYKTKSYKQVLKFKNKYKKLTKKLIKYKK